MRREEGRDGKKESYREKEEKSLVDGTRKCRIE